jgi:ABC-type lipopolysaccharide export system ATPase subunit
MIITRDQGLGDVRLVERVRPLVQIEGVEDAVALRRGGRDRFELARQVVLEEAFREQDDGLAPLDVTELRDDVGEPLQELPRRAVGLVDDHARVLDEQLARDARVLAAASATASGAHLRVDDVQPSLAAIALEDVGD